MEFFLVLEVSNVPPSFIFPGDLKNIKSDNNATIWHFPYRRSEGVIRSVLQIRCSYIFANFTGKHLCRSFFVIKLQALEFVVVGFVRYKNNYNNQTNLHLCEFNYEIFEIASEITKIPKNLKKAVSYLQKERLHFQKFFDFRRSYKFSNKLVPYKKMCRFQASLTQFILLQDLVSEANLQYR